MSMSRILTIIALLAVLGPAQAVAGPYVSASGGAVFLADSDLEGGGLDGVEAEFDTGFGVTGAVGWASDAATIGTLRTELEVGYRTNEVDKFSGPGGTVSAGDTDLRALSGMVNVALDLSASPLFEPYVMGGIGLANLEVDFDDFDVDEDDTVFAFQAGAGINVPVGVVTLFGGYRFFGTSDPEFDGVEAEYNSHNLEVGVRVGF